MSRMPRLLVVALISASLAVFAVGSATFGAVRKVALGVSMNDSQNIATVDAFTASAGRKPAIWTLWNNWGGPGLPLGTGEPFPTAIADQLETRAITPMIMWQPSNPADQANCTNWRSEKILEGLAPGGLWHDYVRNWAQAAKDHGGPILLRFMHEMNGYFYVWGMERCNNTAVKIKDVWRAVWNIFRGPGGVGATNVKFLWSVSGAGYVKPGPTSVFPGDAYVDYLGLTAFNWGKDTPPGSFDAWRSLSTAVSVTLNPMLKLNTSKPIIIAETGSAHKSSCPNCKATWITSGYKSVYNKWPRIKAIVYMNIDLTGAGHPDWRLTTPPNAFTAYKALLTQPKWQGVLP